MICVEYLGTWIDCGCWTYQDFNCVAKTCLSSSQYLQRVGPVIQQHSLCAVLPHLFCGDLQSFQPQGKSLEQLFYMVP